MHDLTFVVSGGVNGDTDFDPAPLCGLGYVLMAVFLRVLDLCQRHVDLARVVLCRVDVKDAHRHVRADARSRLWILYVVSNCAVVALRLRFGWRGSPGF